MHQSRDPAVGAIGGGGDHHPAVAVADQRRAGDVGAIEEPQYVVGVRVEVGGRDRRVVVVWPQTGQGQGVNGVTGTLQQRNHRLDTHQEPFQAPGTRTNVAMRFSFFSSRGIEARCLDDSGRSGAVRD